MMKEWMAKLVGKVAAKKIGLEDTKMADEATTKKWYKSKGVWTGIVTGVLGIYMTLQPQLGLPTIPEWVFALLGGLGIYTRVTADTKIG